MDSIEKIIKNPNGFKKFPNWLIGKIMTSANRMQMLTAAWVYIFMLDRAELSLQSEWIDADNNAYIYFTYKEVRALLSCGVTTAWKVFSCLKKAGLITVKQQGFGLPNKIYVHTPDKKYENISLYQEKTTANNVDELRSKYPQAIYSMLSDIEIAQVIQSIQKAAPEAVTEQCEAYANDIFIKFLKICKRKTIQNPVGYILSMISKFRPPKSPEKVKSPSFDLDEIMEHAKNTPLIPLDNS